MFLIVINKIRILLLIKSELRLINKRRKRGGLIFLNKLKKSESFFTKVHSRKYLFNMCGECEFKMINSSKIKEGLIYTMPLEFKPTNYFAERLIKDIKIGKKHDSKKEIMAYFKKKEDNYKLKID
jgi:hypothetical protein